MAWADARGCDNSDPSPIYEYPSFSDIALERADNPFPVFEHFTNEAWSDWAEGEELASPADTAIPREARDEDPCTDHWRECADGMKGL